MNKNAIIGVLVAVVVIGGGYLLLRDKPAVVVVDQTPNTPNTPDDQTPVDSTPNVPQEPGVPIVLASSNSATWASSAVVTGQINPNGLSTSYWYEYGTTTALGTRTATQALGSGYGLIAAPAYIIGLKANTQYYFRLSAQNNLGTVNGATHTFSTNNNPPPQGVAATARTNSATNVTRVSAQLNSQVNPGGSATTYWFEYGKTTGLGNLTSISSAGSGTENVALTATLMNLDPLTKYYFRINAQNQYGTVNGTTMNFTTKGPASVSTPSVDTTSANNIGTTTAQFTGRINPNGAETTYWFEYSSDSLLGTLIGSGTSQKVLAAGTSTTNVNANVTGLRTKTTYYYRLVARNSAGTERGEIVSFKTK